MSLEGKNPVILIDQQQTVMDAVFKVDGWLVVQSPMISQGYLPYDFRAAGLFCRAGVQNARFPDSQQIKDCSYSGVNRLWALDGFGVLRPMGPHVPMMGLVWANNVRCVAGMWGSHLPRRPFSD